jgi:hypothetical protein
MSELQTKEKSDSVRLEWLITGTGYKKAARVMGSDARGWAVCDCSNGLTFMSRRSCLTFRDAIDSAMEKCP